MPDYIYDDKLYKPSNYDEGYRQLITPYIFQNINAASVGNNASVIQTDVNSGLLGLDNLKWLRAINTEDYEDELDGTFERDFANVYGKIMQEYFGNGNWDLTINPNISKNSIINAEYEVSSETSILYPQCDLFWNSYYNRYYAVWYTPIQQDRTIISKSSAISYIKNLSNTASYILNDDKGIILKVNDELGFSPRDILSVSSNNPTEKVLQTINGLPLWSESLNNVQNTYFKLLANSKKSALKNQYLFIDEDKNIFNSLRKTYLVFKVSKDGYYGDLHPDLKNGLPEYWSATKDYNAGDFVLGNGGDGSNKNYLYCCLKGYKAKDQDGQFHRTIEVDAPAIEAEKIVNGKKVYYKKKQKVSVNQWYYITDAYAREIEAIEETGITFNPKNYIRFSFPALEEEKPVEYYPNGTLKPNQQEGQIYWGTKGITLREIHHHKYTGEVDKDGNKIIKDYYNYHSIYESDLDRTQPLEKNLFEPDKINYKSTLASPSTSSQNILNSSKKLVRYFKKTGSDFVTYAIIEAKIKRIKDEALKDRTDLLKIVFRSAVDTIGNKAFSGCTNLTHAILPKNLRALGLNAFASCTSLKRATLPANITSLYATYIGCTNLQSVSLSENCTELSDSTFSNCINLKNVYHTSNLQKIGRDVFNGCENLKNFTIPEQVTEIPSRAFKNCKNAIITIKSDKITALGESCFENCEQITEAISFKDLIQLERRSYKGCINLTTINFDFGKDNKNKIIPESFCEGCYRLKEIDLGAAKKIEDKAFLNCASLEIVKIPETVTFIGQSIFYDCFRLGQLKIPLTFPEKGGSWIENVLNSTNKTNWIDSTFTKVMDYNGEEIQWQMILKYL